MVRFRQRLGSETIIGTFVSIGHPTVVEILGRSGFDAVCLDAEHAPHTPLVIEDLIRAADSVGIPTVVRVPGIGPAIGQVLDSGAAAVLVPMVETADQARDVVSRVRYPPIGRRGAGVGRASAYGAEFGDYLARANDDLAAIVQIETADGVANVGEIAAVEGVDMLFVGPGDLAVSLGVEIWSPEHVEVIRGIIRAGQDAGIPVGIFAMSADAVPQWVAEGISLFLLAGDLALLGAGARDLASTAKAGLEETA